MKILIYSYNFLPKVRGGMERFLLSFIEKLKNQHQVILLLPNWYNILLKKVKIYNIPEFNFKFDIENISNIKFFILGLFKIISGIMSSFIKLPLILIKNKVDIVCVFQPSYVSSAILFVSQLFKRKTIINLRGVPIYSNPLYQLAMESSFFFSNNVLMNSKNLLEEFKQKSVLQKLLLRKRKFFIPNGIDTEFWRPNKEQSKKKEFDIVFVGNLHSKSHIIRKGIKYLYNSVKFIKEQHKISLNVVIIGKYNIELLKKIVAPDINKHLKFNGLLVSKTLVKEKVQNAKIFVLTSISEGMPNSLMEAMALGMPCIASNVGGVSELIDNKKNGLIFNSKNSKELAELILKLLQDIDLQKKIGLNARQKMIKFFNWDRVLKSYEILFKQIVKLY